MKIKVRRLPGIKTFLIALYKSYADRFVCDITGYWSDTIYIGNAFGVKQANRIFEVFIFANLLIYILGVKNFSDLLFIQLMSESEFIFLKKFFWKTLFWIDKCENKLYNIIEKC